MDMHDLSPAAGRLPERDELTEAIKQMSREREPSTSKLAGTFSTPQSYNLDQLHEVSKSARQAMRPAMSPLQFGDQRAQRMTSAIDKMSPKRETPEVHVHVQGERQPQQPQQQRPEYSSGGQYTGPDVQIEQHGDIATRIARDIMGGYPGRVEGPVARDPYTDVYGKIAKPPMASTTPQPGSQVGSQFSDIVPRGYPGDWTAGKYPYQSVSDRIENSGRFAGNDQRSKENAARPAEWAEDPYGSEFADKLRDVARSHYESAGNELGARRVSKPGAVETALGTGRSVSSQPTPGTVLGAGQFGKSLGQQVGPLGEDAAEDAM